MKFKKIAFITWDGTDSNYLENLFAPIFFELKQRYGIDFYIIQFSWTTEAEIVKRTEKLSNLGLHYKYLAIKKTRFFGLTKFISLLFYRKTVQKYLDHNEITYIMPRSTMPALLTLLLNTTSKKIIFDADGLPILERIEFGGLKTTSLQYKILSYIERTIVQKADTVITRSKFASLYLSSKYHKNIDFFTEVVNGKNPFFFCFSLHYRNQIRKQLDLNENSILFIYCGSLGQKYRLDEMFTIFNNFQKQYPDAFFLILTRNEVPNTVINHDKVKVMEVANSDVPKYLSAADIGLGLIKETVSMQAAAAIKYSEYLLCGLPIILSNIGTILQKTENKSFVLHYTSKTTSTHIYDFVIENKKTDRVQISNFANLHFSILNASNTYYKALCLNK